jgi:cytochrome c
VDAINRNEEMLRIIRSLMVLPLIVLPGCGGAQADAARGRILSEQWCAQCHGVHLNEPSADPKAPSFSAIAGEPSATDYALRVFLRTPHPTMPNFVLQSPDIEDLVSYIVSLKRQ